ncbi:hypothetical protein BpHYR1_045254 [Brachionus plicatilis]|uniref:Uncharacterized protein n=1 Tax=Brachionus plicatilis TaxID=10195 RepID=A0A3M7QIE5_BRAPC|nr:hypothetical protein BpHYR1_045254 [Brachionus plicatilis]
MEDLEYFKKKILDHYFELHNSLDIYTETILAKNDFTEEKIQDLNLKRKSLLDQMEMIKKCNLDNLEKNLLENAQILSKYKPAFYKTESDEKKDNDQKENNDEKENKESYRFKDEIDINEILFKNGFCCDINYKEKSSNRLIFIIWPYYLSWFFLKDIKYVFDNGLYLPDTRSMFDETHNFMDIQDILLANLVYYGFKNLERSDDSINIIDFLHTKKISSLEISFPDQKYLSAQWQLFRPI